MNYPRLDKSKLKEREVTKDLNYAYHILLSDSATIYGKLNSIEIIEKYIERDQRHLDFLKHVYQNTSNPVISRKLIKTLETY